MKIMHFVFGVERDKKVRKRFMGGERESRHLTRPSSCQALGAVKPVDSQEKRDQPGAQLQPPMILFNPWAACPEPINSCDGCEGYKNYQNVEQYGQA